VAGGARYVNNNNNNEIMFELDYVCRVRKCQGQRGCVDEDKNKTRDRPTLFTSTSSALYSCTGHRCIRDISRATSLTRVRSFRDRIYGYAPPRTRYV